METHAPKGIQTALDRATNCRRWSCWMYSGPAGVFVIRAGGVSADRSDAGFLVFKNPYRVRLPWYMDSPVFKVAAQPQLHSVDQCDGAQCTMQITDERGWCRIICDDVRFFPHAAASFPTAPLNDWPDGLQVIERVVHADQLLASLRGADIRWDALMPSHGYASFLASSNDGCSFELRIAMVSLLDWARTMHHVSFRRASVGETDSLRETLHASYSKQIVNDEHLIIDCKEGRFQTCCSHVGLRAIAEGELAWYRGSVWDGGPALDQLFASAS